MNDDDFSPLEMGPALVQKLLPQRPPFLFVDRMEAFAPGEQPAGRASRYVTANEPWCRGHFPELPLMPGALLVEGLGQACSLVFTLDQVLAAYEERGHTFADLQSELALLDAAYRLTPTSTTSRPLVAEAFSRLQGLPVGVAGGIRLKFLRPVIPGCRLDYEVQLTHRVAEQLRFSVSATVDGQVVAEGSLAAARVDGLRLPGTGA